MNEMKAIYLDDAIDAINGLPNCPNGYSDAYDKASIISALEEVPSAQPEIVLELLKTQPTIEPRKKGQWIEREVSDSTGIEEWQSAKCSVCGLYHTTPYMYYFQEYEYCPHCGARMTKGGEDEQND
jgi:hypothetical protein